MVSPNNGLRLPPPWISSAAGPPDREVRPVIFLQRRASSGYAFADADAQAWANAVAAVDGAQLPDANKSAIDSYVQALKAGSIWSQAVQWLVHCGPATLTGALVPLKGPAPTNVNFVSGNYNRKNGLGKASNTNAYLIDNVPVNALGATSHALFAYGSIATSSGNVNICGRYDGTTPSSLLALYSWAAFLSPSGRAFASATVASAQIPIATSAAAATSIIGSRTSATAAALYVDGNTASNSTN